MPQRIQRKRTKGWRMPEGAVYVGRPTVWGNPFRSGQTSPHNFRVTLDAQHAVDLFRQICEARAEAGTLDELLKPLSGKDLACWCPLDQPCHADVLLELANR